MVYNLSSRTFTRVIKNAHCDSITTVCITEEGQVVTGSRSLDGTVTVWVDMVD